MRCGTCRHEWHVTAEWLEQFDQALEGCPVCGTDCRSDGRPDFWAEPESRWHDDTAVPSPPWELLGNVRADGSANYTWVSGGNTAGVVYRFAVVAQDCTPNVSSFVVDTALTN